MMSANTTNKDPGRSEGGARLLFAGGARGSAAGCAPLPFPPAAVPVRAGSFQVPAFYLFWLEDVVLLQ